MDNKLSFGKQFKRDFSYICAIAVILSFVGFVVENIFRLITCGIFDNRFHFLPFIPVYGLIAFVAYFFGNPNTLSFLGHKFFKKENVTTKILSNIIFASICVLLVFVGELAVGNGYEYVVGVQLWNYSNFPLHVTQYTSLLTALGFGLGSYLLIKFIYIPILNTLKSTFAPRDASIFIWWYALLFVDMIAMIIITCVQGTGPIYWEINIHTQSWPIFLTIEIVLCQLFFIFLFCFLYSSIVHLRVKREITIANGSQTKFAILIPARNESAVIDSTLNALNNSFYKREMFDVYVMVEDPKDKTLDVCKNYSNVYGLVRQTKDCGKGYVLDEIVKYILKENKQYDAYLILDADNIVDVNFLQRLSDGFKAGNQIVVGNRYNKNPNSSATSCASGITFTVVNKINKINASEGEMVVLSGTGFCIDASIINKLGGWSFHSMTEDVELTNYSREHGLSSYYMDDAIFYDEQPIKLKDSIKQRTRWVSGFFSNNKKQKTAVQMTVVGGFGMAITYFAFVVFNLGHAIYSLISGGTSTSFKLFLLAIIIYFVVVTIASLIILTVDQKKSKTSTNSIIIASLFHPVFLATYLISLLRLLNKKNRTWEVIPHTEK